jgi:hypothetical protein
MTIAIDPGRCPLCGEPNRCAMVIGRRICWCFALKISAELLERVPVEARERACVCERCVTATSEPPAQEVPR